MILVLTFPSPGLSSHNEVREGWWSGPGYESMHVQGRRWAGAMQEKVNIKKGTEYQGSTYDAASTFASYGLLHGDPGMFMLLTNCYVACHIC